ncbi:unnamed protein product [Phytophthora fragariaefolia]|uniref:Unnamed protein product n=1 Tax=Phytophthora fragariaefolia TaxID=1490495 RepID=A0A9W6U8A4_9STRA|nr:unnamed protein product [Phytophthora fragariaefolia]
MCSDCSSFLYFEFSHRKHRVCAGCNNQLLAEQEAYDREALAQQRETASNVFDDSSDDGRPSGAQATPMSSTSGDVQINPRSSLVGAFTPRQKDEKARKKQEKKERKERMKREKREKKAKPAPVSAARISRRQVEKDEEKPGTTNGAPLFDGADDDWFTDVPQQRSRNSGDDESDEGTGSKGPGWRDRVKDTYTVEPATTQPSVLVPMTGSTLTAGITGKGYISDQFRYDNVGGPGLGHDDDASAEMPRPIQQQATAIYTNHSVKPSQLTATNGYFSEQFQNDAVGGPGLGHDDDASAEMPRPIQQQATAIYTNHSVKPSRLTATNGYFSEQFEYDAVGGPGLGHDDDQSVAMPRPKQLSTTTPYSYDGAQSGRHSARNTNDDSPHQDREFQPRLTFKENLKDIISGNKRRESTATKKEKKIKASKPRARGNQSMTLDELNPSYSSEDEPRRLDSTMLRPTTTSAQPTFYDDDADKLVIDDSAGFFEATTAEREAQRKKEEEQQQRLTSDMAWVHGSAQPPTVPPHRFSSEQDSYSIVDPPSHTSNSPAGNERRSRTDGETTGSNGNTKGGFAGALKRFFGMGSKSTEKVTAPPKATKVPATAAAAPPKMDNTKNDIPPLSITSQINSTHEQTTARLERHTVMDYYADTREDSVPQENTRATMAAYVHSQDAHSRLDPLIPSQTIGVNQIHDITQQQDPERKRRDTFDDLFESPKNNLSTSRYSSAGANRWAATTTVGQESYEVSGVGVARFDQRRSIAEADDISLEANDISLKAEAQSVQPPGHSINSTEAWRQSAAMSLLDDRKDLSEPGGSGFTWSNVRSVPGLGTATYAVPTSLQPRAVYHEERDPSFASSTPNAPPGNIMDDLKRSSTSKNVRSKESVDDFFAEFEEPNDYVFDPATGGYVAARVPQRSAATRPIIELSSTELVAPPAVPEKIFSAGNRQDFYNPSEPVARSVVRTVTPKNGDDEEVDDDVAEIIVDKISSLESELAALKHLIRSRKGNGGNSNVDKPRMPRKNAARSSVHKASIFDNDSSDEEIEKATDPNATSLQLPPEQEERQRPGSKKKQTKKRKDSFADLFEDSPNESATVGGATSYEALFQAGTPKPDATQEEDSDDGVGHTSKPMKSGGKKSRRRSSRKINDFITAEDDPDSEPEFVSLKGRGGKRSFRKNASDDFGRADIKLDSTKSNGELATPPQIDVIPVVMPTKKQVQEEDPIDALFDISNDNDVSKLYREDSVSIEEDTSSLVERQAVLNVKSKSELITQASSTPVNGDEVSAAPAKTDSLTSIEKESSGRIYDSRVPDMEEVDAEEDFQINWTKMKKTKPRRHRSRRELPDSLITTGESVVSDNTSSESLLEPRVLSTRSDIEADDKETSDSNSLFLANAASNWMSITNLENETVNLRLTGDEEFSSLLSSANEDTNIIDPHVSKESTDQEKSDDEADLMPAVVSVDLNESDIAETVSSNTKKSVLTGYNDNSVDDLRQSSQSYMDVSLQALNLESSRESDTTFDIFDKSGDVDFVSMNSLMNRKALDDVDESNESKNVDKELITDEDGAFSFEIRAPTKQVSVLNVEATSSVSDQVDSPLSPLSSADDNVHLGKYISTSVPSSTTPSVDGSVDDPEDVPVDEELVLGKVESQAFDSDWNQMQAKEKERKKRLQAKQRQAQRDKIFRKQGASSKALAGNSTPHGSSKSKSKSGKKKKKDKDDTIQSSHHNKSGSSRKHRHRQKEDTGSEEQSDLPRSLTEL